MTKDEESMMTLPKLMAQLEFLNSDSMSKYEKILNKTTESALEMLSNSIADGSLALDPESLVNAVKVLTNARHIINDDKRKLLETTLRGTAMLKAVQNDSKSKKEDNQSLLDKYFNAQLPEGQSLEDTAKNSVFNFEDEIIDDDKSTESSSDQ